MSVTNIRQLCGCEQNVITGQMWQCEIHNAAGTPKKLCWCDRSTVTGRCGLCQLREARAEVERLTAELKRLNGKWTLAHEFQQNTIARLTAELAEAQQQRDAAIEEFQAARDTSYLERAERAEAQCGVLAYDKTCLHDDLAVLQWENTVLVWEKRENAPQRLRAEFLTLRDTLQREVERFGAALRGTDGE